MTLREALLLIEVVPNSFIFLSSKSNQFVVHVYFKNHRYCVVRSNKCQVTNHITVCDRCEVELLSNEVHECTSFVDIAEATIRKWLPQQASGSFIVEGKWHDVSIPIQLPITTLNGGE